MLLPHSPHADRKALLLGTALASTLLLGTLTAPTPASAQATCFPGDPGVTGTTGPITIINPAAGAIDCDNIFDRYNAGNPVIDLGTNAAGEFITLDNSGNLTSPDNRGIRAYTLGVTAPSLSPTRATSTPTLRPSTPAPVAARSTSLTPATSLASLTAFRPLADIQGLPIALSASSIPATSICKKKG